MVSDGASAFVAVLPALMQLMCSINRSRGLIFFFSITPYPVQWYYSYSQCHLIKQVEPKLNIKTPSVHPTPSGSPADRWRNSPLNELFWHLQTVSTLWWCHLAYRLSWCANEGRFCFIRIIDRSSSIVKPEGQVLKWYHWSGYIINYKQLICVCSPGLAS